jgi:hypothetical protein
MGARPRPHEAQARRSDGVTEAQHTCRSARSRRAVEGTAHPPRTPPLAVPPCAPTTPPATRHPPPATRHPPPATRHPPPATRHPPPATRHPPPATRHNTAGLRTAVPRLC